MVLPPLQHAAHTHAGHGSILQTPASHSALIITQATNNPLNVNLPVVVLKLEACFVLSCNDLSIN